MYRQWNTISALVLPAAAPTVGVLRPQQGPEADKFSLSLPQVASCSLAIPDAGTSGPPEGKVRVVLGQAGVRGCHRGVPRRPAVCPHLWQWLLMPGGGAVCPDT